MFTDVTLLYVQVKMMYSNVMIFGMLLICNRIYLGCISPKINNENDV